MENKAADALSRMPNEAQLSAITIVQPPWLEDVKNNYVGDTEVQAIITQLQADPLIANLTILSTMSY